MKILNIGIRNLASLEGDNRIDFTEEPLRSAGIYAITGPTGAGKSTILDALCLALFGRTPRYMQAKEMGVEIEDVQGSKINQGDPRGILRDGTGEGAASVTFIGIDNIEYEATWSVRRAKSKPDGNLQGYTHTLRDLTHQKDMPGTRTELQKEIERLIGLNFEQFTRSVLLAQGDFTAFMRATKDEKSALLEKLTGTQIYSEISQTVYNHCKSEETKIKELQIRQGTIETLSDEAFSDIEKRLKEKEALATTAETTRKQIETELQWHTYQVTLAALLQKATENYDKSQTESKAAKGRQQQLQRIEAAQPARSWVEQLQNHQEQFAKKSRALTDTTLLIDRQDKIKAALSQNLMDAKEALNIQITEAEKAKPLLVGARKLDIQLEEKQKQEQDNQAALKIVLDRKEMLDGQHARFVSNNATLDESVVTITKWLDSNKDRESIAENESLIISKLEDARQYLKELEDSKSQITSAAGSMEIAGQTLSTNKKQLEAGISNLSNQEAALLASDEKIAAIENEDPEARLQESRDLGQSLITAKACWSDLLSKESQMTKAKDSTATTQKELQEFQQALTKSLPLFNHAKSQLDAARVMLDKAKITAAENVKIIRAQLGDNEACPVCGSKEHPYSHKDPGAEQMVASFANELKSFEEEYELQNKNQFQISSSIAQNEKRIKELEAEITLMEPALLEVENSWKNLSVYSRFATIPPKQVSSMLEDQLKVQNEHIKNFTDELNILKTLKLHREKQRIEVTTLKDLINQLSSKDSSLSADLKMQQQALELLVKTKDQLSVKLGDLQTILSTHFPVSSWFENWKTDPDKFTRSISAFVTQWKAQKTELDNCNRQIEINKEKLTSLSDQLKDIIAESVLRQSQRSQTLEELAELKSRRKNLFGGVPADQVEMEMNAQLTVQRDLIEKLQLEKEDIDKKFTQLATQKEGLLLDTKQLQEQITDNTLKIDQWLLDNSVTLSTNSNDSPLFSSQELFKLLEFTPDWINRERASLKELATKSESFYSALKERKSDYEQHKLKRPSPHQRPELEASLTQINEQLAAFRKESAALDAQLSVDLANKKKLGKLIKEIEAQNVSFENWSKLNALIGSKDGKKFREIAQEYTLEVLLNYANQHLKILSKRYLLQRIPGTLGLQVLDQDMGDEIRTVYSLSGGESFLVSLALALGLASLSSNKMKVESLFIDEGFGSLDPTTLNIAMDALERLHDQGRKVGVISHVQEMTERIPVQIQVLKHPNGKSAVEVVAI